MEEGWGTQPGGMPGTKLLAPGRADARPGAEHQNLQGDNLIGLRTFLARDDDELDALVFLQTAEPLAHDGTKMNKYVITILTSDEAITFLSVEPLNGSGLFL